MVMSLWTTTCYALVGIGTLGLQQTINVLQVLNKLPVSHTEWDSLYVVHFIDKHFGTTTGATSSYDPPVLFHQTWRTQE